MKTARSGLFGLLLALGSGMVIFSAISFSLFEGLAFPASTPTIQPTLPLPNLTPLGMQETLASLVTATAAPQPTTCPHPATWNVYIIQPDDDLITLADERGIRVTDILNGNCLVSSKLLPDTQIYLPPLPTETHLPSASVTATATNLSTPIQCGPPASWVLYTIQPGDTLLQISRLFRVTVWQLKTANCLSGDTIRAGAQLWVPNVPMSTYTYTPGRNKSPTPSVTSTAVPTQTRTSTPTFTHTVIPSSTTTSTATVTSTPTVIDTPTLTATSTETPVPTPTSTSTETPVVGVTP